MSDSNLHQKKCKPCEGGVAAMTPEAVEAMLREVKDWKTDIAATTIAKTFQFGDFQDAIVFTNKVARIAEEENHHPDIFIHKYRNVTISLSTHAIGGLSENDFIMAAKIDGLVERPEIMMA